MSPSRPEKKRAAAAALFVAAGLTIAGAAALMWVKARRVDSTTAKLGTPVSLTAASASARPPSLLQSATTTPPLDATELGLMLRVPAGTFTMGSNDGDADEKPDHRVEVATFELDRTEVTVRAYSACVAAGACEPRTTVNGDWFSSHGGIERWSIACNYGKPDWAAHPMNCVDWNDATQFCKWAAKRLPTEEEWEYAARGSDNRAYPWGNAAPTAMLLNACGSECAQWAQFNLGSNWSALYPESDHWPTTAPVGSFPAGSSPFGLMDMAGNVWEWVANGYSDRYDKQRASDQSVLRGGSWNNGYPSRFRAANRDRCNPLERYDYSGFRCAR